MPHQVVEDRHVVGCKVPNGIYVFSDGPQISSGPVQVVNCSEFIGIARPLDIIGAPMTLDAVATILNVTRERIRQVEELKLLNINYRSL